MKACKKYTSGLCHDTNCLHNKEHESNNNCEYCGSGCPKCEEAVSEKLIVAVDMAQYTSYLIISSTNENDVNVVVSEYLKANPKSIVKILVEKEERYMEMSEPVLVEKIRNS
jgi:hypothetical protein